MSRPGSVHGGGRAVPHERGKISRDPGNSALKSGPRCCRPGERPRSIEQFLSPDGVARPHFYAEATMRRLSIGFYHPPGQPERIVGHRRFGDASHHTPGAVALERASKPLRRNPGQGAHREHGAAQYRPMSDSRSTLAVVVQRSDALDRCPVEQRSNGSFVRVEQAARSKELSSFVRGTLDRRGIASDARGKGEEGRRPAPPRDGRAATRERRVRRQGRSKEH
jgi:hypothetical protein